MEIDVEGFWTGRWQNKLGGGDNRETIMKYAALPYCQFIVYRFLVQSYVFNLIEIA